METKKKRHPKLFTKQLVVIWKTKGGLKMPEGHTRLAVKLCEAAEQAKISEASLCAKCDKTCPRVSAVIAKYTGEYSLMEDELERLKQQLPKPKPNLLGAGRKPKVTPQIIKAVLKLREDKLSFGEIANAINEVSDIKISRSTAYEIYDKYGREQSSFSSDNPPPEAVKAT